MSQSMVASTVPDEEGEKAPKHHGVHDARVGLGERARLSEHVLNHQRQALGNSVEAEAPDRPGGCAGSAPGAVGEDGDGHQTAHVQRDPGPHGNVPERVAEGYARGHAVTHDNMGSRRRQEVGTGQDRPRRRSRGRLRPKRPARGSSARSAASTRRSTASVSSSTSNACSSARRRRPAVPAGRRSPPGPRGVGGSRRAAPPFRPSSELRPRVRGSPSPRPSGRSGSRRCRCTANFSSAMRPGAPERSALLTTKMSAASMRPAFMVCTASPDSGTSTYDRGVRQLHDLKLSLPHPDRLEENPRMTGGGHEADDVPASPWPIRPRILGWPCCE